MEPRSNPLITFIQDDILLFIDYVLVPLVFSLAFIVFLWGIFNFFIAGGADEEKREKGKQFMVWGLIGFFVMVSVWGIVNLFVNSFGFGGQQRPDLPSFGEKAPSQQNASGSPFPTNNNSSGRAGSQCESTTQCDGGLICLDGTCESASTGAGVGSACEATVQCASGLTCIEGTCER